MTSARYRLPSGMPAFGRIAARLPLAAPGQRIGLLGGSFNPPHEAHLLVSEEARRRLGLDRVWWIVTPGNPLKQRSELAPLDERLTAARRLAGSRPISVTAFERNLDQRFTITTLRYVKLRQPTARLVWIMGADCLAELHRWRDWRGIMRLMPVVVVDRPGWRLRALAGKAAGAYTRARVPEARAKRLTSLAPPAWTLLTTRLSPLSSTAIRARATRPAT